MLNEQTQDEAWMRLALNQARAAMVAGEVPVGAVVVHEGQVIAAAHNERESAQLAHAHAELLAIERACRALGRWRLTGCTLYVTLEPCLMCAGTIVNSRVDRVVYGAADAKAGAVESLYQVLQDARLNHRPEVSAGVLAQESRELLQAFFRERRG